MYRSYTDLLPWQFLKQGYLCNSIVIFSQTNTSEATFSKQKPKVIHLQQKNFCNDHFRIKLGNTLLKYGFSNIDYDNFVKTFQSVLKKHTPIHKKYLRPNHVNFMTKQIMKAIMKRSKLHNGFLKDRNVSYQNAYRKQRSLCVTLLRKAKNSVSRIQIQKLQKNANIIKVSFL